MNIINLPINITVKLVSHHTDNILMIKFRKQQFPESFVAYITSGCANKMPARPALSAVLWYKTSASAMLSKIVKFSSTLSPLSRTEVRIAEDWPHSSSNPKFGVPSGPITARQQL